MIPFWTAVAAGLVVALLFSATNVPGVMGFGVILGTLVAGAVASGARRGGPAAFLVVFFWGATWLMALPSLGMSTAASLEGGLPTSIAVVFAASIFGLLFGMLGGLLGRLVRCIARIFYFPVGREKEINIDTKLIVYKENEWDTTILSEARVDKLFDDFSRATLAHKEKGNEIMTGDLVITK